MYYKSARTEHSAPGNFQGKAPPSPRWRRRLRQEEAARSTSFFYQNALTMCPEVESYILV